MFYCTVVELQTGCQSCAFYTSKGTVTWFPPEVNKVVFLSILYLLLMEITTLLNWTVSTSCAILLWIFYGILQECSWPSILYLLIIEITAMLELGIPVNLWTSCSLVNLWTILWIVNCEHVNCESSCSLVNYEFLCH